MDYPEIKSNIERIRSEAGKAELLLATKTVDCDRIEYAETNLNLEDNHAIQNQWKRFKAVNHKRRRSYVKKLED